MTEKMTRERVEDIVAAARVKNEYPDLRGMDLSRLDLRDAYMRGANLSYVNLRGAHMRGAIMTGATLSNANLSDTYLDHADLSGARLADADLTRANLTNANLRHADLTGADLRDSNLSDADLRYSNMRHADMRRAILTNVNLYRADMTEVNLCGLFLDGLPSGRLAFFPTPEGWGLAIGCWDGTTTELRDMISEDTGWPQAEGEEVTARRPALEGAATMCDAFAATHPDALADVTSAAERWKENR